MQLFTDGGARGNPGPGAAGAVIFDEKGTLVAEKGLFLGTCTNNEAEYLALKLGIDLAIENKIDELNCNLDSELVVKQLNGQYKVKNERLEVLFKEVKLLVVKFSKITFTHIPRTKNKHADQIVNTVLDSTMTQ